MTDELKIIVNSDQWRLKHETLYKNIMNSTRTHEELAEMFNIPIEIVITIKSKADT